MNPVKSVVQNADGLGATVTYADNTTGQLVYPTSTAVSDGVNTTTTHADGTTHTSCDNPVKDVLDSEGNSVVENGVATIPAAATSGFTSNSDGTTTHDDGNGNSTTNIQEDIVDGGSNLVNADGVTINPVNGCAGTPIDVTQDKFISVQELVDNGYCLWKTFEPSGAAGNAACTPVNRTGCIDFSAVTQDPFGRSTWVSDAGQATWTEQREQVAFPINERESMGVIDGLPTVEGTTFNTVASHTFDIPNPSTCRTAICCFTARFSGVLMEIGALPNSWQVNYQVRVNGLPVNSTNNWWSNQHDEEDAGIQPGELIKFPAVSLSHCQNVAAGDSLSVELRLLTRALALTPDPKNAISFNDGETLGADGMCVLN